MFNDRRRLRLWAAQMLLVWLFGLAMSVANACALGQSARHAAEPDAAAGLVAHHRGDADGEQAKANCLDFCEQSSIGALQPKIVDDSDAILGLALPASGALSVAVLPGAAVGRLAVDSPHLPGGPPLRIAFQRLAL